ncbi:MAG: class I SAM-dependent methyltransferase [Chloroflexi bacterium]|nr:class I SAM-dependent methyltransferase [Chloroflexota bacterium]
MANKDKYEQLYQLGRGVCGTPLKEFVEFFDSYNQEQADVLDLGCGQGRDAFLIARKGHHVLGVDVSLTGIAQMLADAKKEDLNIEGVVADIVTFKPIDTYDVVLLDRVLHLLDDDDERTAVLETACQHTKTGGFILIVDTLKQKELLNNFLADRSHLWQKVKAKKNILFIWNHCGRVVPGLSAAAIGRDGRCQRTVQRQTDTSDI